MASPVVSQAEEDIPEGLMPVQARICGNRRKSADSSVRTVMLRAHDTQVSIKYRGVDWCKIHDNVDGEEEPSG